MRINSKDYKLQTDDGKNSLVYHPSDWHLGENNKKIIYAPSTWLITRKNGSPLFALEPAGPDEDFKAITADTLYSKKIQWFDPSADHYRKLLWVHSDAPTSGTQAAQAFKHFQWSDIIDFSVVDRLSISFSSRLSGDWKASREGADGFLLVLVEGIPYWSDAIGQIPFAVDTYRHHLERLGDVNRAIRATVETGITYGDGNPLIPNADQTNEYDNYMVLRGALWAAENFQLSKQKRVVEGNIGGRTLEQTLTIYNPSSDSKLRTPVDVETLVKYGAWLK